MNRNLIIYICDKLLGMDNKLFFNLDIHLYTKLVNYNWLASK